MISIFADRPRPSSDTTVTMTGETMPGPTFATDFLDVRARMPRHADRAVGAADREHVERRLEAAAIDEVGNEFSKTLIPKTSGNGPRAPLHLSPIRATLRSPR
jgi:hypothetical protein